jgi:hypothetical protein
MADNTKVEGFTPGPWRLVEDLDQIGKASHRVYSVHADVPTRAGSYAFCGLARITADRGDAILEANARLIAAAPDLYEALTLACEQIADLRHFANSNGGMIDEEQFTEGLAALAKADGLSPTSGNGGER